MKLKTKIQMYTWRITCFTLGSTAIALPFLEWYFTFDSRVFLGVMLALIYGIFVTGIVATNEHKYEYKYEEYNSPV